MPGTVMSPTYTVRGIVSANRYPSKPVTGRRPVLQCARPLADGRRDP
jgi:hypothetical protein